MYTTVLGSNITQTHNVTSTSITIGSLYPSYTYQFSVAAYTVANGPTSIPVIITLPEDGI